MSEKDLYTELDGSSAGKAPAAGTVGGAPKLRAAPVSGGKRLSKKSRVVLMAIAIGLGGLILVGILTAGSKPTGKPVQPYTSGGGNVGVVRPATAIMIAHARAEEQSALERRLSQAARPASPTSTTGFGPGTSSSGTEANGASPSVSAGAAGKTASPFAAGTQPGPGGPQAQTPQAQYAAWVQRQKYQRLENAQATARAALTAKPLDGGGAGGAMDTAEAAGGTSSASGATGALDHALNGARSLLDMQRALLGHKSAGASTNANESFLNRRADAGGYLPDAEIPALGRHELIAGSVIPAVLVTAINSNLPGTVTAEVRQTVYDSFHPDVVLIPQGTRLVGEYSSNVGYGQSRVLVAWDELILPNGSTVDLKRMEGVNGQGQAGLRDLVHNHYLRTFGSAILMSALGVAAQLSQPQSSSVLQSQNAGQTAAGAAADSINQVAAQLLERNLNVAPTLIIRPGFTFNVMVNKTMILSAYDARD
jgi:type IV secretion system protein VirB10